MPAITGQLAKFTEPIAERDVLNANPIFFWMARAGKFLCSGQFLLLPLRPPNNCIRKNVEVFKKLGKLLPCGEKWRALGDSAQPARIVALLDCTPISAAAFFGGSPKELRFALDRDYVGRFRL